MMVGGLIGMLLVGLMILTALDFLMPRLNERVWEQTFAQRDTGPADGAPGAA